MNSNKEPKIISVLHERLSTWESSVLRKQNLTPGQAETLGILIQSGPIKMKDLAQKKGITSCSLTDAIDRLVKKEMVVRRAYNGDRRVLYIALTKKGRQRFNNYRSSHADLEKKIKDCLTEKERGLFKQIIKKAIEVI